MPHSNNDDGVGSNTLLVTVGPQVQAHTGAIVILSSQLQTASGRDSPHLPPNPSLTVHGVLAELAGVLSDLRAELTDWMAGLVLGVVVLAVCLPLLAAGVAVTVTTELRPETRQSQVLLSQSADQHQSNNTPCIISPQASHNN